VLFICSVLFVVSAKKLSGLQAGVRSTDICIRASQERRRNHPLRRCAANRAHSRFAQLQRLLPDRVKIDRTFVRNVSNDRERSAIARSIIALAHTLEITVVADGIANELDLQFFKWEGCDIGQGELLATSTAIADVHDVLPANKVITH
jgi:hypothetical protein